MFSGVSVSSISRAFPGRRTTSCAGFCFGLAQQPDNLVGIEPIQTVIVDRENLIARRHAGFFRGRVRRGLQHHHAPGSTETTVPNPFCVDDFHLLKLLELAGIEEDRMRVQMAQQPRYRALVKRLIQIERIGRILFQNLVRVDELLHLRASSSFGASAANERPASERPASERPAKMSGRPIRRGIVSIIA